ncbi:hypothetical protein QRX50_10965 [Amycolatopsis carbonis]|uniref:Secreted protein n=1 Tax=Amycolatopsis carbonis TaxID=715471 RepID=A0A9Y2MZS4_9PSEU|nr:hypothetical protein [Amycolatopsis sp. 2-15]WIX81237.1 hypothetical protein QRX50_10965 [Amycolatopsis sp. 2-15]
MSFGARLTRRLLTAMGVVSLAAGLLTTAVVGESSADTAVPQSARSVNATYHTWAADVNARGGGEVHWSQCANYPSTTNCDWVIGKVSQDWGLDVICQRAGQTIGGNPYWVLVDTHVPAGAYAYQAWIASYYIDYPSNQLPVRTCNGVEGI